MCQHQVVQPTTGEDLSFVCVTCADDVGSLVPKGSISTGCMCASCRGAAAAMTEGDVQDLPEDARSHLEVLRAANDQILALSKDHPVSDGKSNARDLLGMLSAPVEIFSNDVHIADLDDGRPPAIFLPFDAVVNFFKAQGAGPLGAVRLANTWVTYQGAHLVEAERGALSDSFEYMMGQVSRLCVWRNLS